MCAPTVAAAPMFYASLAVSGVTSAVSYAAKKQQAEAQEAANEANKEATRIASIRSMNQKAQDIQQRELQERASTALKTTAARDQVREAQSTARATSESAGLSIDALLSDYDRQYADYASSQLTQLGFTVDQIGRTREGIEAEAETRVNTVPQNPVARPSAAGALADFGGDALGAYRKYSVRDPMTGDRTFD